MYFGLCPVISRCGSTRNNLISNGKDITIVTLYMIMEYKHSFNNDKICIDLFRFSLIVLKAVL